MLTNNCIDNATNRVYINRNFNRSSSNNIPNSAGMHINPRFSHLLSNVQPSLQNKAKIYVNPNFVKSSSGTLEFSSTNSYMTENLSSVYQQPIIEKDAINVAATTVPTSRSRYTLVRHTTTKLLNEEKVEQTKRTYQVNKYKSIPLKDIKRNLDYPKNTEAKLSSLSSHTQPNNAVSTYEKYSVTSSSSTIASHFKLVNHKNIGSVVRQDKIKLKSLTDIKKVQLNQTGLKRTKGNLKKNNIPCPMFRKFGKCLRKMRGNCEFLHDKKHVSICRKFIKGLCHDKNCLLSHDLTTKKMPTCYFYLQGTCTKSDCPYLHVKLNEKVKICPDFLKGYCEKGNKCLQRHIQSEKAPKHFLLKRSNILSKKKLSRAKDKTLVSNKNDDEMKQSIKNDNSVNIEITENTPDCRYYQEQRDVDTSDNYEIIKPMRCKLGTLPSFIQL